MAKMGKYLGLLTFCFFTLAFRIDVSEPEDSTLSHQDFVQIIESYGIGIGSGYTPLVFYKEYGSSRDLKSKGSINLKINKNKIVGLQNSLHAIGFDKNNSSYSVATLLSSKGAVLLDHGIAGAIIRMKVSSLNGKRLSNLSRKTESLSTKDKVGVELIILKKFNIIGSNNYITLEFSLEFDSETQAWVLKDNKGEKVRYLQLTRGSGTTDGVKSVSQTEIPPSK